MKRGLGMFVFNVLPYCTSMGKYCTASVKLEQVYIYMECTYDIYIYTITTEVFLQVWGSLRLAPIIHYCQNFTVVSLYAVLQKKIVTNVHAQF